jgi:hypothetical protein
MTELFRYIEQAFALPAATDAIGTQSDSPFQTSIQKAVSQHQSPDQIRSLSGKFLDEIFPQEGENPVILADQLLSFTKQLRALTSPSKTTIEKLVEMVFDTDTETLVDSDDFLHDKDLLNDALISIKLVTGFDRVNAADLATERQATAFLEGLASGDASSFAAADIRDAFRRPLRISKIFVDALKPPAESPPPPAPPDSGKTAAEKQRATLVADQQSLQSAYETIMSLHPHEFELQSIPAQTSHQLPIPHAEPTSPRMLTREAGASPAGASVPRALAVSPKIIERLGAAVQETLEKSAINIANTPVSDVVASIKREWQNVSRQLAPYQIPAPLPVVRVGVQLFAIQPASLTESVSPMSTLFRKAITRPVGIGDLQVVRQELTGYEAGEISHIENVLEGELLRRSTRREEVNELTTTQETDTTQVEERDQQSTSRNELSTEAQNESSQQTTSVKDQTTTTDYGKLVENSKTNYARSVTDRAVNTLTQMVKLQRVQREKKTFSEKAVHELDNRQNPKKVRGIYQWVDKKYKARILNYGKRLLYDVVIPEPAAFLLDSLKNAAQPENSQLTKPVDPQINPSDLNPSNYSYYASQYGVTGSVTPPPDEFIQTVTYQDAKDVTGQLTSFGGTFDKTYYAAFPIQIPDNTKAVSGYIQRTNPLCAPGFTSLFEFFIGDRTFVGYSGNDQVNTFFTLNGETGVIPVTMHTFEKVLQFNFAIGINCQRTDKAYEQWQLKTHAVIVSGYQRQLADYQDKLTQYQTAVRSQLALAQNFAHDPSIEEDELKKAFIFLLLGEHFSQAYHPTPDPEAIPPDPTVVRDWGPMVAFFERAFEWENIMYTYYPYFWGRQSHWSELILIQDIDPQFEAFLKAGAARVVIPTRPGFEGALAHYQETGDIWMGEEIPDMFSDFYVSIIEEIKARNFAPGSEICVAEWDVTLPTTLVMLKDDETLPTWKPTVNCNPPPEQ